MDLRINDESGRPLLSELDVDTTISGFDLVLHASGGASRGLPGHNPDYIKALEILLSRLRGLNADIDGIWVRSEEHTSELQSLMRISYAVFCLKKKTKKK